MVNVRTKRCAYLNCSTNSAQTGVRLFSFRKHDAQKWIGACGNSKLSGVKLDTLIHNYYVCNLHFCRTDYTCQLTPFKTKLKKDAIPRQTEYCGEYQSVFGAKNSTDFSKNLRKSTKICSFLADPPAFFLFFYRKLMVTYLGINS